MFPFLVVKELTKQFFCIYEMCSKCTKSIQYRQEIPTQDIRVTHLVFVTVIQLLSSA